MNRVIDFFKDDPVIYLSLFILLSMSVFILNSIAPDLFPQYYLFIFLGVAALFFFLKVDFELLKGLSLHFYILSVVLLLITLAIGQITRGTIRWIPLGGLTLQPSEIIRPFLLLFFASYLAEKKLTGKRFINLIVMVLVPTLLIFVQPSLGVAIITFVGFLGVLISSDLKRKNYVLVAASLLIVLPIVWMKLADYQKQRIVTFVNPYADPQGAGYNSIQSMIAVGSGRLSGRGLGKGVQTQLRFLPEKHSDFIFASIAEELGFAGASIILVAVFAILFRLVEIMKSCRDKVKIAFLSGLVVVFLAESVIHIGMNLGLLPITGIPLPFVSAGGSSFLASMISIAVALRIKREIVV
ncbi:MAG: FtsW/RodA/SpoVE family cell cycle protein [Candidatus Woesebacteria bacterium]|jgi:rod shape determining protein RodA